MDETLVRNGNNQEDAVLQADRVALNNMFRAIAEYGHKIRLRRQAESSVSACEDACKDQSTEPRKVKRKKEKTIN
jgi:hypothetical protein